VSGGRGVGVVVCGGGVVDVEWEGGGGGGGGGGHFTPGDNLLCDNPQIKN